jgi:N-methylhydantoinase A
MVPASAVVAEAAKTVMSGPASGVIAAADTARRAGVADLITYDMGGTSSDVAVIRGGVPAVSHELELEYAMPIHVPMIDVRTVGSGGGSIARVDGAGILHVGPQSAGADPGPIHYGRGGAEPTISDANLVLGRLDPAHFLPKSGAVGLDDVRARLMYWELKYQQGELRQRLQRGPGDPPDTPEPPRPTGTVIPLSSLKR